MSADRDVCVIGGGVNGLATAYFLSEGGANVTVLEADHIASGSSGLSVGIIETQYMEPLEIALRVGAMAFFAKLESDHGLDITRNGYMRLARDEDSLAAAQRSAGIQNSLGVDDATVLGPDEIKKLIPQMFTDDVLGGLWGPSDGYIDGHLYCNLLAELLPERGVDVKVRQKVTGRSSRGDRQVVETEAGLEVECDFVVNAAGAWGSRIAELLGTTMPLDNQRHQALVIDLGTSPGYVVPSVMDYIPHSGEEGLYFRHERDGQLIGGLHTEEIQEAEVNPDNYGRGVDHDFMEGVARKLSVRLPGFPDASLGDGWAGIYPMSPDGVPQVGPSVEDPTVINVGGAGGAGIQLSPALGKIAASWIIDGNVGEIAEAETMQPGRPTLEGVG